MNNNYYSDLFWGEAYHPKQSNPPPPPVDETLTVVKTTDGANNYDNEDGFMLG